MTACLLQTPGVSTPTQSLHHAAPPLPAGPQAGSTCRHAATRCHRPAYSAKAMALTAVPPAGFFTLKYTYTPASMATEVFVQRMPAFKMAVREF